MKKIKVFIIEDSKMMQELLNNILSSDDSIQVVGIAEDPLIARELIKRTHPDVLTLDVMLPHMDGITFLKNLMRLHPLPVVMVSTLTEKGSAIGVEALASGAVDYLVKPTQKDFDDISIFSNELLTAVKNAAETKVMKHPLPVIDQEKLKSVIVESRLLRKYVIGIGASTGGIEAIETILLQLPKVMPPVVIVQHIRKEFSTSFTQRINKLYGINVVEITAKTELLPGTIYIASGGKHAVVSKEMTTLYVSPNDDAPFNRHKPSIDVLFQSLAANIGSASVGILLTGMGADGAQGLKAMRDKGAKTIVQDEATSVVWGMPGAAVKLDAADIIAPINDIPRELLGIMDNKMLTST